jgi:hypothetical protein
LGTVLCDRCPNWRVNLTYMDISGILTNLTGVFIGLGVVIFLLFLIGLLCLKNSKKWSPRLNAPNFKRGLRMILYVCAAIIAIGLIAYLLNCSVYSVGCRATAGL